MKTESSSTISSVKAPRAVTFARHGGLAPTNRFVATNEEVEENADKALQAMDEDGDGIITKAELDEWAKRQEMQALKPPGGAA